MKKLLVVILSLALVASTLVGCSSGTDKQFITVVTGGSSGAYFALGGTLSTLLNENYDYMNSSVESTGASSINCTKLGNNEADIAFAMNNAVSFAYDGIESFSEQGKVENLRGIASLYPNFCQVITTAETGIESIEDLAGKRVGVGAPGSGTEVDARSILEAHGLTYDDIDEDFLSYAEAIEQLKNGTVDAAFLTSGIPNATVLDLATTHDAVIIPITSEKVTELAEDIPFYSPNVIPAGMYGNAEDVETAAVSTLLITREELSEQAVYDITKVLFENLDALTATHNSAKSIDINNYDVGMPIPLHPGAIKYYQEVGIME